LFFVVDGVFLPQDRRPETTLRGFLKRTKRVRVVFRSLHVTPLNKVRLLTIAILRFIDGLSDSTWEGAS
jgi:hypothetical protein